jgi:GTP-binding protein
MKIISAEFIKSGTNQTHMLDKGQNEFLFCGRSNVGKSSFINALMNRKNLAHTSSNPGKTQTLNLFLINNSFIFVDVPGYGYAKVSKTMREEFGKMIEEYITNRKELKCAFLLVDFRHEPTKDDCMMYDFLKYYNIPVCIICTKLDKVKKSQVDHQKKIIRDTLKLDKDQDIIVTSSETKEGIEEVRDYLDKFF